MQEVGGRWGAARAGPPGQGPPGWNERQEAGGPQISVGTDSRVRRHLCPVGTGLSARSSTQPTSPQTRSRPQCCHHWCPRVRPEEKGATRARPRRPRTQGTSHSPDSQHGGVLLFLSSDPHPHGPASQRGEHTLTKENASWDVQVFCFLNCGSGLLSPDCSQKFVSDKYSNPRELPLSAPLGPDPTGSTGLGPQGH